jgi:tetratricopeptide (TPR) repeat protein
MSRIDRKTMSDRCEPSDPSSDSVGESSLLVTNDDLRIAALLEEFETSNRCGKKLSLDAFLARNHEVAAPLKECLEGLQLLQAATTAASSMPTLLPPGTRLGDFEIERQLDAGSMGTVYQAKQLSLSRSVALKVLTPSPSLSKLRIERFRREVMAASSLDHPNIIPVYQVGEDLGLHFYAMRKIDGQSLDRLTPSDARIGPRDNSRRGFRELAAQFAEVADALHEAHRQGVVHRDLKPSNLIADQTGRIWVADFGLARHAAIDDVTQSGEIVGTLRYMSPEQARGRSDAVDGRTDVYGIGATLYELLSGVPPFHGFEGIDLLRQIQHAEPTSLRKLNPTLPRDLVTIVQRAMRPEKSDRYGSAAELASDLRQFAAGKPIAAHSVSVTERGLNWTRRNLAVVLGTLALTLLGFAATLVHNQRLQSEQDQTKRAAEAANRNYGEARRAVDQLGSQLAERLLEIPGTESVRQELLRDTLGYYERFVAASENDPQLRLDVAKTRLELARLHVLLSAYAQAQHQYAAAATALKASEDTESQLVWCQAVNELAMLLSEQGEHPAALRLLQQISLSQFSSASPTPVVDDKLLSVALTLNNLAIVTARLRRTDEAIGYLRRAILVLSLPNQSTLVTTAGANSRLQGQLADAMSNLSTLMSEQQRETEALSLAQQAVKLRSALLQQDAAALQHQAIAHSNLAATLMRSSKTKDAVESFQSAIDLFEKVRTARPQDPLVDGRLAVTLNNFAMARYALGDTTDAEALFHQAQAYVEAAINRQPTNPTNHGTAAGIMNNLGVLLRDRNRSAEARQAFEAAIQFQQAAAKLSPSKPQDESQLSQIQSNLESLESKP